MGEAPPNRANKKSAGDSAADSELSDPPDASDATDEDQIMEDGETTTTTDKNIQELEESNSNITEESVSTGDADEDDDAAVIDDDCEGKIHYTTEDNLLHMILTSAGDGTSLFTSWEPGRQGQFYFLTTTSLADRAAKLLDDTMSTVLNTHGIQK